MSDGSFFSTYSSSSFDDDNSSSNSEDSEYSDSSSILTLSLSDSHKEVSEGPVVESLQG